MATELKEAQRCALEVLRKNAHTPTLENCAYASVSHLPRVGDTRSLHM